MYEYSPRTLCNLLRSATPRRCTDKKQYIAQSYSMLPLESCVMVFRGRQVIVVDHGYLAPSDANT
ncbi:unnamed protein product [Ectocarpus sp. CCAP 1310/34]|nr:unnamed protein product [Ectocarpus sp. CCAP 1310/34]